MKTSQYPKIQGLFLGHGSPMNAIENNPFSNAWELLGKSITQPKAILAISAHWETHGTYITAVDQPRTIHDFGNFPQALFDMQYPAKGDAQLVQRIQSLITRTQVKLDYDWGLDHGTWCLLTRMFPEANVPVLQLSLNRNLSMEDHYHIGQELKPLRDEGVLILGSGNIVHNLSKMSLDPKSKPFDWAIEFDARIKQFLLKGNHQAILDFESLGNIARLSVPTPEHFLPLIYIIALQETEENITFPVEGMVSGSISMRGAMIS